MKIVTAPKLALFLTIKMKLTIYTQEIPKLRLSLEKTYLNILITVKTQTLILISIWLT